MYTTCVIWLAFVPLYFGTGNHVPLRITSMSVTISLSASVTLACLFSPKLYIILVHPERNVRQSMMPVSVQVDKNCYCILLCLSVKDQCFSASQEIPFFYTT
jgi:metabotropic X receptor